MFDNCEHLLDEVSRLGESILRDCPEVRILASSREGLGVPGEQMVAVRSLPMPGEGLAIGAVAQNESVLLFTERAAAARAGFALEAANAGAVVEICRRLDGIPLAIELAAARVAAMNPSDIATHIDERFRLLTGGRRSGIERHQTLRATVDWSYSLLDRRSRQCSTGSASSRATSTVLPLRRSSPVLASSRGTSSTRSGASWPSR